MPVLTRRRAGIHAPLAEPLRRVDGGHGQAPLGVTPASERLGHGRAPPRGALPRGVIRARSPYRGGPSPPAPPAPPPPPPTPPPPPPPPGPFPPRVPPHTP